MHILGDVPYRRALLRKEYTRNLMDGHGEFVPCMLYGVRVVQGFALQFQAALLEPYGGAQFLAPLSAFARIPCGQVALSDVQPYDCFSSTFSVHEFSFLQHMRCSMLPTMEPARYWCSPDYAGSALSEDAEQHKHHHLCWLQSGALVALPNNRLLFHDDAYWQSMQERPDFLALGGGPYYGE